MIATVVMAVSLALPSGFAEAKVLEPAASYVAGKPVHVYCAPTDRDLWDYAKVAFGATTIRENGYVPAVGGDTELLSQSACWPLRDQLQKKHPASSDLALGVLTLTHESVHLRGVSDEGQTECTAIHTMPRVAVRYFHVKAGKQLRGLMSDAWSFHEAEPSAYTAVC